MKLTAWIIWGAVSLLYNIALTINSRAKLSRSWRWNACTSFGVGLLYMGSVYGLGSEILWGSRKALTIAFAIYGLMSSLGSVIGQEIVLKLRFFQRIEEHNNDKRN